MDGDRRVVIRADRYVASKLKIQISTSAQRVIGRVFPHQTGCAVLSHADEMTKLVGHDPSHQESAIHVQPFRRGVDVVPKEKSQRAGSPCRVNIPSTEDT